MKLLTENNRPDLCELLTILQEECAEASMAASKLIRFGLDAQNPASPITNVEELTKELRDIVTIIYLITNSNGLPITYDQVFDNSEIAKKLKKISVHSTYWKIPEQPVNEVS